MPQRRRDPERATLERARELRRSQTESERVFWELVRDRRLDGLKFRRQHRLGQFIADFYYPELQLVVELVGHLPRSLP